LLVVAPAWPLRAWPCGLAVRAEETSNELEPDPGPLPRTLSIPNDLIGVFLIVGALIAFGTFSTTFIVDFKS
jgi:hypothetical protein